MGEEVGDKMEPPGQVIITYDQVTLFIIKNIGQQSKSLVVECHIQKHLYILYSVHNCTCCYCIVLYIMFISDSWSI